MAKSKEAQAWSTILGEDIAAVYNGVLIKEVPSIHLSAGEIATLIAIRTPIKFPWDEEDTANGHS